MKKLLIAFIIVFSQLTLFSQQVYPTIKVSKDIELVKLSNNTYVHVSFANIPKFGWVGANGLIYINGGEALLFDTPWNDSLTKTLVDWLRDSLKVKIVGFVPNHWHEDCIGGLEYLQSQKIESYANQKTIDIAKSKKLPVPAHGFADSLVLKVGSNFAKCYYLGAAHTIDNIVVWIPSEKILFAGCMVKSLNSNSLGNTVDGDLKEYPKTIDRLIMKFPKALLVIPGHGDFGGFDLITHTKQLSLN